MTVDLYTKLGCAYCNWAKTLLHSKGITYKEHKLGENFNREFIIENFPNAKTFPVIVVDGFDVGGYEGLKSHLSMQEAPHITQQFLVE